MNFLDFKNKEKLPLILGAIALISAVVALVLYVTTGVTNYTVNKLDSLIVIMLIVGIALNAITIIFDVKIAKYAVYIAYLVAWLQFIVFEIDYIASIFVGIDNTQVTMPFVLTLALLLVATVLACISAAVKKDSPVAKE